VAPKLLDDRDTRDLLQRSVKSAPFDGTLQQKQGQRQFIEQLSLDYLQQEIDQVIVARQIYTLKEYAAAQRTGRKVRFNAMQRRAVWSVYETFLRLLQQQNKITWRQARSMAEAYVTQGAVSLLYDAVVIDEAQDLDPSALRLLVQLCKQPNRVFITADANQSIYGSGFNWADVHEDLRFQGRTAVLHANYRSTREIGEAAQAYLAGGALDGEPVERVYVNSGPPPVMRIVQNNTEQVQLLVNFFRQAQSAFRLGIGSCAILCPTVNAGKALAEELKARGLEATFMAGYELDLARPGVKVLTLKSSKGLEFPIVALAGFLGGAWQAAIPAKAVGDEREEFLALERRTMFVGMTRAMRALLVAIPERAQSPLFSGFEGDYWNTGE
jgi:superfamily I DNA/RNA helicase